MKTKRSHWITYVISIAVCVLAAALVAAFLLTDSLVGTASGGFSKTYEDNFTLKVSVTRDGPIYSIPLYNHLYQPTKGAANTDIFNMASATAESNYVRLQATGEDCYVAPLNKYYTSCVCGCNWNGIVLPKFVYIKYRVPEDYAGIPGQIFAGSGSNWSGVGDCVERFNYNADGKWHLMRVDLALPALTLLTNYFRFDFFDNGTTLPYIDIQMIAWFRSDADAENYNNTTFGDNLRVEYATLYSNPAQTLPKADPILAPLGATVADSLSEDEKNTYVTQQRYKFVSLIDEINGVEVGGDAGSDPDSYKESWRGSDLRYNAIPGFSTQSDGRLTIEGWAMVAGGISDTHPYVWSFDQLTWYAVGGRIEDLTDAELPFFQNHVTARVGAFADVAWSKENVRFAAIIDLSCLSGNKVENVYVGVRSKDDPNYIIPIIHFENVTVQ